MKKSHLRIAIVHDSLVELGGAERVLSSLLRMFSGAHVYTAVLDVELVKKHFAGYTVTQVARPGAVFREHSSLYQALSPLVWRSVDLSDYDVVISISGHLMSNLVSVNGPVFIQYILTPPRNIFSLDGKTPFQRLVPYDRYLKRVYEKQLHSTPHILTLSKYMQEVLQSRLHIQSKVVYPPVSVSVNSGTFANRKSPEKKYYLVVSRLDRSKSIELAILACNVLKEQLLVVGDSNEPAYEQHLRTISGPTIHFTGYMSDSQVRELYKKTKAFLFTPKQEDFGIAPVEAMANGVPVIGYFGGGLKETLIDGKTGVFFYRHDADSLIRVMRVFAPDKFRVEVLKKHAALFSEAIFMSSMRKYIDESIRNLVEEL